jgi:ribonuclease HI
MPTITIHTDGASRGNPGEAGAGALIVFPDGTEYTVSEYLGNKTNNEAEYQAIALALERAKQRAGKQQTKTYDVIIHMDSELAQKQLTGEYKLKNETIQNLFIDIWNKAVPFQSVSYRHVPREHNKRADTLANQALDT